MIGRQVYLDVFNHSLRSIDAAEYEGMSGILAALLGSAIARAQLIHTQKLQQQTALNKYNPCPNPNPNPSELKNPMVYFHSSNNVFSNSNSSHLPPFQAFHRRLFSLILISILQFASIIIISMQSESQSSEIMIEDDFEVIVKDIVKNITSSTISESRKILLITTAKGFVLCDLLKSRYIRFEDKNSPFYVESKKAEYPCGSRLGSILESRTEVALVPNFNSDRFKQTYVYIYDYKTKIILSKFNFNLPINMFSITNTHLIVSNNKRIVMYNYLKSRPQDDEKYYLETYKSNESTDFINYFELFCHLCDDNQYSACECGKYCYSKKERYMKLVYMRIGFSQNIKSRILYLYDEKLDTTKFFYEQKPYSENFHFSINEEGKYLAICEDYGRKITIYNLVEKCLYTVLYLGRQPKNIVNLNVITLPTGAEWVIASRETQGTWATMHFFKLAKTTPSEPIPSRYKRQFRLFKQTLRDYEVFQNKDAFINPEFYLTNCKLFVISLLGEYCEIIDLDKAGLHDKADINDYKSIEQYKLSE